MVVGAVFIFWVQEIVDCGETGLAILVGSWLLMRRVGFLRVLGNRVLFGICLLPLLIIETVLLNLAHGPAASIFTPLVDGVIVAPLTACFVTVMYFLARDRRGQVEHVLGSDVPVR